MRIKMGIDLGTSNVVVAYMKGGQLVSHDWGALGQGVLLPAFVQYRNGKVMNVGKPARRAWQKGESGCYRRFKMEIGRQKRPAPVSAEQLMTFLVAEIKRQLLPSETNVSEIKEIESVVITVPHGWQDSQRRATRRAVEQAGLKVKRLVSEPVAAAAYYAYARQLTKKETVLVCDMGGGTFDITLTEVQPGRKIQVLEHGTETNEYAGTYADALIGVHILHAHGDRRVTPESLLNDQGKEIRDLLQRIEIARLRLNELAEECVEAGDEIKDLDPEAVRWQYSGSRKRHELEYEEMVTAIQPVCDQAEKLIKSLLSRFPTHRPTGIVLAGGMSKMLVVQEAIARATGFPVKALRSFGQESDRAIARGAALIAEDLVQVDEVLPYGIGIIAYDYDDPEREKNFIVLPRGTSVPCRQASGLRFSTKKRRTHVLDLKIGIGNSENPAECDIITRELKVNGFLRRGTRYEFVLNVDENLLLTVEAQRENAEKQIIPIQLTEALRGSLQAVKPV